MATVYGHARYGEAVYGDTSVGQALPPPSHVVDQREQPVLVEPVTPQAPPVTLPREQSVYPHREGGTE